MDSLATLHTSPCSLQSHPHSLASAEGEEDSPQQVERRRPRGGFRGGGGGGYRNNYRAPYGGRGYRGYPRRSGPPSGPPASGVCVLAAYILHTLYYHHASLAYWKCQCSHRHGKHFEYRIVQFQNELLDTFMLQTLVCSSFHSLIMICSHAIVKNEFSVYEFIVYVVVQGASGGGGGSGSGGSTGYQGSPRNRGPGRNTRGPQNYSQSRVYRPQGRVSRAHVYVSVLSYYCYI